MSTLAHGYSAPQVGRGLAFLAYETLKGAAGRAVHAWEVRRDVRAVSGLSDAALSDIGVGRGFEEEAVRHGRGRRLRTASLARDLALPTPASWTEWR